MKTSVKTAPTAPAKPKLSFKEMLDQAAIGDAPTSPATSGPSQPSSPTSEQEGKKSAAPPEAPAATLAPEHAPPAPAPPVEAPTLTVADPSDEPADELAEEEPSASPVAASDKLDLAALFVASPGKKPISVRITDDHQHFFTLLGHTVGGGASATTIIHNLLTDFRNKHESALTKLMRKKMLGKR